MIQLSRNYSLPEREADQIRIKVVGIGGAGSNALDRVVLDGLERADLVAMNTDVQSLASSVAASKVQLGRTTTRGLGAGGDPELGFNAAHESADEIRSALANAGMIFLCSGLGGGTGSGAAPVIAQLAREAGAMVVGFATLPFSFEGKRRSAQANIALRTLREQCDAVLCFENDRLGDMVAPKAGIHQAFAAADHTISQSVRSIVNLIQRPGLVRIGFDDLLAALRSPNGRCLFGFGESDSDNRAHEALTLALKNPLMERGDSLDKAAHILVQISGGPGMTLAEVEIVMKELGRHVSDETQILFGTAVDSRMGDRLSVTIISSLAAPSAVVEPPREVWHPALAKVPKEKPIWEQTHEAPPSPPALEESAEEVPPPVPTNVSSESFDFAEEPTADTPMAAAEPAPVVEAVPKKRSAPKVFAPPKDEAPAAEPEENSVKEPKKIVAKQEVLQFEPITRGRFEKSEPTIVEGEDLDVPTFLRKGVRVK